MLRGLSGTVAPSQTHQEAFGSMRTIQATTDQAAEKSTILDETRIIALALISVGALLIAIGPWLSGSTQSLGAWCQHATSFSARGLLQELSWLASQHCGYCYLGAAMIGIGIATGLRRGS
jgi:hypothetical protein